MSSLPYDQRDASTGLQDGRMRTQDSVADQAGRRRSLRGAAGSRLHPRVEFPLEIEFQNGSRRAVRDWSLGGLGLDPGQLAADVGDAFALRLIAEEEVLIDVTARVVRAQGGDALGLAFIDLSPAQAQTLDRFMQARLDGDAAPGGHVASLLQRSSVPAGARRVTRSAVDAGKPLLMAALIVLGGVLVLSHLLTVTADYAAVSADLRQVSAPEAGYVVSDVLSVGARVGRGQIIAWMQPVPTPQARLATESQIIALDVTLAQQTAALAQTRDGFETYLKTSRTNFEEATAARKLLDQQVAAGENNFERLLMMQGKKIVSDARVDQERQVYLGLQRTLSAARDAESAARNRLVNAEAGLFASDGRSTQKSPADIERSISTTRASIDRLREISAALDRPMPVVSPCDCRVASVSATPGVYVLAGAGLADLAHERSGKVAVDALIQNPRLGYLRQGQTVAVTFANTAETVDGRVVSINYNPANTGRIGLPNSVRTLADYGLITIEVEAPGADMVSGLPATVVAPIGWRHLLASAPPVVWFKSLLATTSTPDP